MGIHPAPSFVNIYLAKRIDEEIVRLGFKYGKNGISAFKMIKRFLDDLFHIFVGTSKQLHKLYDEINKNPSNPEIQNGSHHPVTRGTSTSMAGPKRYFE